MSLGAERVLTQRELNRAVLDRQLLLTRRGDSLPRALERRSVVQATLMRVTIHLVSAADYWPFAIGVRAARRERWMRARQELSLIHI